MASFQNGNRGFSLMEVLIAVGILSVGMIFIAGVFPAGIHFATIATERSIAAAVADEAFAKIKLYATGDMDDPNDGIDLSKLEEDELTDFNDVLGIGVKVEIDPCEFAYPSTNTAAKKQYFWSALCRLTEDPAIHPNSPVQITVFVSRKVSPSLRYFNHDFTDDIGWPMPVKIGVLQGSENNELEIDDADEITFINDGYTILDDKNGRIYRILERYRDTPDTILLDRDWEGGFSAEVWVVPPPLAPGTAAGDKECSGRGPCIAVYQKVIRF